MIDTTGKIVVSLDGCLLDVQQEVSRNDQWDGKFHKKLQQEVSRELGQAVQLELRLDV